MGIFSRIAKWYRGPFIPPDTGPGSLVAVVGHHEPPLLAKFLRAIGRIVAAEWKWLITATIGIVGIVVAAMKLH